MFRSPFLNILPMPVAVHCLDLAIRIVAPIAILDFVEHSPKVGGENKISPTAVHAPFD
jgi:hypothetical protein